MIETITVITLSILYLVFFRPGKTPPLDNQLIIERPGRYKMTLAPKLNTAQPFIEAVIDRIVRSNVAVQQINCVRYFAVSDRQVATNNGDIYLLAIIYRAGMLYLWAEQPFSNNPGDYLETIRTYALKLVADIPARDEAGQAVGESIVAAIKEVSEERGVTVELLSE